MEPYNIYLQLYFFSVVCTLILPRLFNAYIMLMIFRIFGKGRGKRFGVLVVVFEGIGLG